MYVEGVVSVENSEKIDKVLLFDIVNNVVVEETTLINCKYRFVLSKKGEFIVLLRMKDNAKTSYYSEVLYGKDCPTE